MLRTEYLWPGFIAVNQSYKTVDNRQGSDKQAYEYSRLKLEESIENLKADFGKLKIRELL